MVAKSFFFTKITVGDPASVEDFYTAVLGLEVLVRVMDDDGRPRETVFVVPGNENCSRLIMERRGHAGQTNPGETVLGFAVDDVDATVASAITAGGALVHPPQDNEAHGIRIAFLTDPDGQVIELLGPLS
ncbi:hypothetical protein NT2_09_01050 [Caenibius tardaugens NBRC 16725]|uniref:VOC domain-containing protein n=1 Tax=Caenibius tardaugens NBRC 16725 TaxID=1219035 RepID=U2YPC2_9SPHN|nr:VOC family protein [Caenibius tardaugens]AZI35411.1 glyoxalase/bleomycin resistance/dioxygenase family protein [Caenibius tardaugens NBRC 16725]GAD50497.1 hypothetical protein NT2_09_01050 [Caenibius tardaugens NBRC 16725]